MDSYCDIHRLEKKLTILEDAHVFFREELDKILIQNPKK